MLGLTHRDPKPEKPRHCARCNREIPPYGVRRDGYCVECRTAYMRAWYAKKREARKHLRDEPQTA